MAVTIFKNPKYNPTRFQWMLGDGSYQCISCGSRVDISAAICESCLSLKCQNCRHRLEEHQGLVGCPIPKKGNDETGDVERKKHLYKKGLLNFASWFSPKWFAGVLKALGDYDTGQIRKLYGAYAASYGFIARELMGESGPSYLEGVIGHLPATARQIPGFNDLPLIGKYIIADIHRQIGSAQALEHTQSMQSNPQHPARKAQEMIDQTLPTVTSRNFINGLAWNREWKPGVRGDSFVEIITENRERSSQSDPVVTIHPGEYTSFGMSVENFSRSDGFAWIALGDGYDGWRLGFIGKQPYSVFSMGSNELLDGEELSNFTNGRNRIRLRYDHYGRLNIQINEKVVDPSILSSSYSPLDISFIGHRTKVVTGSI